MRWWTSGPASLPITEDVSEARERAHLPIKQCEIGGGGGGGLKRGELMWNRVIQKYCIKWKKDTHFPNLNRYDTK